MAFASICIDVQTRALTKTFDYLIPDDLYNDVEIGCTVLVSFGRRMCVGYVMDIHDNLSDELKGKKVLSVQKVLAKKAFTKEQVKLCYWMAKEYAAPLASCVRLFLAPGQKLRVTRDENNEWQLVSHKAGPVDERIVHLNAEKLAQTPIRKNAHIQKQLIEALSCGDIRISELRATIGACHSALKTLENKGIVSFYSERKIRTTQDTSLRCASAQKPQHLTEGQTQALAAIERARTNAPTCVLIDGVTGSGKTEVYLEAIEETLAQGQSALVLVPEISLTAQTVGRFRSRFGDEVCVLHSRLSQGERYDQWDLMRTGKAHVLVGARSALFTPCHNLGLIIIDEEHESSYKQDTTPRYHARDVALQLAKIYKIPVVLGSATPSFEMLYAARTKQYRGLPVLYARMHERPAQAKLPQVHLVDMRNRKAHKNSEIFSDALVRALEKTIAEHHKAVLLLNRRGFANFLMCEDCGCIPSCPHCSQALTYHEKEHTLMCHACGRSWPTHAYPSALSKCPQCGSRYLKQVGFGTQRVEAELKNFIPPITRIIRMDADTTAKKGAHQKLLEEFDEADSAILLGTQMIAKGLDFPEVTLVGVLNADVNLKMPDFRSAERCYGLLEQVAGRAGRGKDEGHVYIQASWATHPAIVSVAQHSREAFVTSEMELRAEAYYPPYARCSNILAWGTDEQATKAYISQLAHHLREQCQALDSAIAEKMEILGPAPCMRSKLQDRYRYHILIKSPVEFAIGEFIQQQLAKQEKPKGISCTVDVDAYDMF